MKEKIISTNDYRQSNYIVPPHNVRDAKKLENLLENMRQFGWIGQPIVIFEDYNVALMGSHRIAAALKLDIDIPVIAIKYPQKMTKKQEEIFVDFFECRDEYNRLSLAIKLKKCGIISNDVYYLIKQEITKRG